MNQNLKARHNNPQRSCYKCQQHKKKLRFGIAVVVYFFAVVHQLPQAVRFPHCVLPKAECAILGPAGVDFTVRRELQAMNRPKMTLERFYKSKEKTRYIWFFGKKTMDLDSNFNNLKKC
jgi:hypothetical protein